MKKYVVTAAALMLGTSALAWAPAEEAHLGAMQAGSWISEMSAGKTPQTFAAFDAKSAMKAQTAAYDSAPATMTDDSKKAFAGLDESLVETAAAEGFKDTADVAAGKPAVETASLDGKTETVAAGTETGMGGPIEAQGYPACNPGPGDDNCIQLYERGVTQALAGWKGSDSGIAMGGPFEPAADGTKDTPPASDDHAAMGHGSAMPAGTADAAAAKPAATDEMSGDAETAVAAKPAATETPATPGVGGPVEARTDYPPCRPGRGDDNCIQLYERGVSGRKD